MGHFDGPLGGDYMVDRFANFAALSGQTRGKCQYGEGLLVVVLSSPLEAFSWDVSAEVCELSELWRLSLFAAFSALLVTDTLAW